MTWLRRLCLILAAGGALALTGCGDDNSPSDPDAGTPDAGGNPDGAIGGGSFANASAHWVSESILAVPGDFAGESFELYHAPEGGIALDAAGQATGGSAVALAASTLPQAVSDTFPHLADYQALAIATGDLDQVPDILRGQFVLLGKNADGGVVAATGVQIPGVLDDLYTYEGALGVSFETADTPTFRLWAPTAKSVVLNVHDTDGAYTELASQPLTLDDATGVWSYAATDAAWYGKYYRYEVSVFSPKAAPGTATTAAGELVKNLVSDPYSVGLSTNSVYSLIIDLDDPDTQPAGWDSFTLPENFEAPEDIVLYEAHVRDFSVGDDTVAAEHRGKYLAFSYVEEGGPLALSNGMAHLQRLATPLTDVTGVTHLHLLPVFDIATINEDESARVDIDEDGSFGLLCDQLGASAVPAGSCTEDAGKSVRTVLDELLAASESDGVRGDTEAIQALVDAVRGIDAYNWGYDP